LHTFQAGLRQPEVTETTCLHRRRVVSFCQGSGKDSAPTNRDSHPTMRSGFREKWSYHFVLLTFIFGRLRMMTTYAGACARLARAGPGGRPAYELLGSVLWVRTPGDRCQPPPQAGWRSFKGTEDRGRRGRRATLSGASTSSEGAKERRRAHLPRRWRATGARQCAGFGLAGCRVEACASGGSAHAGRAPRRASSSGVVVGGRAGAGAEPHLATTPDLLRGLGAILKDFGTIGQSGIEAAKLGKIAAPAKVGPA